MQVFCSETRPPEGTPTRKRGSKKARKGEDNERTDIQRDIYDKGGSKRGRAEIHDTNREAGDREDGEHKSYEKTRPPKKGNER